MRSRRTTLFVTAILALAVSATVHPRVIAQVRRDASPSGPPSSKPPDAIDPFSLPHFSTKYYELYTDLTVDEAREAALHITKMAEVYADRTRGFSGAIRQKFPFVLFRKRDDYEAAGGPKGSAGFYNGQILVGVAGKKLDGRAWHVIQHEGFHQFAGSVIRGDLPVWINEGLAEYFGEGLYTGDDIITGIVPKWRLKRIQKHLQAGDFKSADQIMRISLSDWNAEMDVKNYDQAWSIVQFLAHGDDNRYQSNLAEYMNALASGKSHADAWRRAFPDSRGFEERWRAYWLALPDDASATLYQKAMVATLTSFLARSAASGQSFATFEDFSAAAIGKTVLTPGEDDLPPSLLAEAMSDAKKAQDDGATFALVRPQTADKTSKSLQPQLVLTTADGRRFAGRFALKNSKVMSVTVDVREAPKKH